MKVAHLATYDPTLRHLLLPQLEAVLALGGEPIGISADGPFAAELEAKGIRHIALVNSTRGFDLLADLRSALELWRVLRSEKPDVLHTHTPKPGVYGRIIGRIAGVPVVVNTIHGLYATQDDTRLKRALVYTLEAVAARFSDVELVQSSEDYKLVTTTRITIPRRTVLLGNGIELGRFDGRRQEAVRAKVRGQLGISQNQIVIGFVGRLVHEKGVRELVEAAGILGSRYVVVVVGPTESEKRDALSASAIAAAERSGVRFVGYQADVHRWYQAMDVFALPSYREGFPRAAMEASAMALPVVATNVRGCREVVDDGVTGVLVPVRDAVALARAIRRIGDDIELRRSLGDAARDKARLEFDEQRVVKAVLSSQIKALRARGGFERLDSDPLRVRLARWTDAREIAAVRTSLRGSSRNRLISRLIDKVIGRHSVSRRRFVTIVATDAYSVVGYATRRPFDPQGALRVFVAPPFQEATGAITGYCG